ncbi:hypothetical protein [Rhodococcus sp. OK302]|uniref:hypothetical protein n=1 Tax=Rhodococcus sp. OK302 TaxID=1882769 RepID=UPI000B93A6BC|nr:hypothetical protein [Rhodococcus sp. OK302]OYD70700.1 hypothetical protein BDB13_4332 [Rhodococcus sp. OK302]
MSSVWLLAAVGFRDEEGPTMFDVSAAIKSFFYIVFESASLSYRLNAGSVTGSATGSSAGSLDGS